MASLVYTDRKPFSARIGGWINWLKGPGIMTDAFVAANPTISGMKTNMFITVVRPDHRPMLIKLAKALDKAVSMGIMPDTHGQTTVAGLVALTDAGPTFKAP